MSEWVLVPKNPTREMLDAAWRTVRDVDGDQRMAVLLSDSRIAHQVKMLQRWNAMLAVAPAPPGLAGWQPIETAPKDGTEIIYLASDDSIGFCHWSFGANDDEIDLWWDNDRDDEAYPRWWVPRDSLPPLPARRPAIAQSRPPQ